MCCPAKGGGTVRQGLTVGLEMLLRVMRCEKDLSLSPALLGSERLTKPLLEMPSAYVGGGVMQQEQAPLVCLILERNLLQTVLSQGLGLGGSLGSDTFLRKRRCLRPAVTAQ